MAVSTDRFRVTSVRPSANSPYEGIPQDLLDRVEGKIITAGDLEELGVDVKSASYYHGGDSLAVVNWHDGEYVLNLEPVPTRS